VILNKNVQEKSSWINLNWLFVYGCTLGMRCF